MTPFFTHRIPKVAAQIVLYCFAIGQTVFLLLLLDPHAFFLGCAFVFLLLFMGIHLLLLLLMSVHFLMHLKTYEPHLALMIAIFINIALALFYLRLLT